MKSNTKGAKETKKRKGKSVLDCVAPDGPVPPTRQSGARASQLAALEISSLRLL
jgi:putative hemolysin